MTVVTIVVSIACFIVGGFASYMFFKHGLKSKYDSILKEAETEAEVIKKNKLLEVKEKFLNKKADLEKEVSLRNQKIQQAENKLKQRELVLNQRQEEIQRKKLEAEAVKENLEAQLAIVDKKKEELEHMQRQEIEKLEAISGLSAEEAKERMVESLKEEAKTQAQSYINDIMDDAKLTASKEAKRIVIQSIQRVATETAIENSVTVFHIESDEIKGRIIGREGRNIRALEAATGVEIVVDDTPEAIVLSAFDPVRREIARLALHQPPELRNKILPRLPDDQGRTAAKRDSGSHQLRHEQQTGPARPYQECSFLRASAGAGSDHEHFRYRTTAGAVR